MKIQENGTVKKNKISSIGSAKNVTPIIYCGLKDHTPFMVNNTSQNKKNNPVIPIPGHINFQLL